MKPFEIHIECPSGEIEELVLSEDYTNNFRQDSPVFNQEAVPGVFTLPVNCPTEGNQKKMGFPERLDVALKPTYINTQIYIEGIPNYCGRLKVKKSNFTQYQKQFFDNKGEFTLSYANQDISNCMDVEFDTGCQDFKNCRIFEFDSNILDVGSISATINGISTNSYTWGGVGGTGGAVLFNDALFAFMNAINNNPIYEVTVTRSGNTLIFCSNNENDIPSVGFNTQQNTLTFTEISDDSIETNNQCMIDYLNNYMTNPHPSHVFAPYYNPGAYDDKNPEWSGFVNPYSQGTYLGNVNQNGERAQYSWSPQISWKYILNQISLKTGYKIKGELLNDPCFIKAYFFSNCMLDRTVTAFNGDIALIPVGTYNIKDCLPEMSIGEFLNETAKSFCAYICFDSISKCIEFKFHKDLYNQNPKPYQNIICGQGDVCYEINEGYNLTYKKPKKDKKWQEGDGILDNLTFGQGENTIDPVIAPMYASNFSYPNLISYRIPCINTVGSTNSFEVGQNDLDPRVVLYHGFQSNSSGDLYPFASYDDILHNGMVVDLQNRCSLAWEGTYGMYEQYFKQWLTTLQDGASIQVNILPDAKFVAQHKCDNVYWLEVSGITGCFIFKEYNLTVKKCGIVKSQATLFYLDAQRVIDDTCLLKPVLLELTQENDTVTLTVINDNQYQQIEWFDDVGAITTIGSSKTAPIGSVANIQECVFRVVVCGEYYYFKVTFINENFWFIEQTEAP